MTKIVQPQQRWLAGKYISSHFPFAMKFPIKNIKMQKSIFPIETPMRGFPASRV
jgi:hypothetical protein